MKAWLVNSNSKEESKCPHCFEYMIRHNKVAPTLILAINK